MGRLGPLSLLGFTARVERGLFWTKIRCGVRQQRCVTTDSSLDGEAEKEPRASSPKDDLPPLSVMPTSLLLRSILITSILTAPRLVDMCLPLMTRMAETKSAVLSPDRNPVLHVLMKKLFYDHFAAGEDEKSVKRSVADIKKMGFQGVILGYAKDVVVDKNATSEEAGSAGDKANHDRMIEEWKDGSMKSLAMLGEGDILALKFTGAGAGATEALALGHEPPPALWAATLATCAQAARQNTRIWIDAEQQIFQPTIDAWTISLMRTYNRNGQVLIYNTLQAYLKATPANLCRQLQLAQAEGWALGVKLVRGAYIASEPRHLIHDTVAETHAAYDGIVRHLVAREFPGVQGPLPQVQLMLASHNAASVNAGFEAWRLRREAGLPTIVTEFAQLQGMADEVSCGLVQHRRRATVAAAAAENAAVPRPYKCLAWGTVGECMAFLTRRLVENRGSVDRATEWLQGLKKEMWRRVWSVGRRG